LSVCVCVCVCLMFFYARAYFSSPYSPSSDLSTTQTHTLVQALGKLERGEEKERGWTGKKGKPVGDGGEKRMERKEREDGRRAEARADRQRGTPRNGKKRTD